MREPGLTELTNFIEDKMVLVNDHLFSRGAVGQYEETIKIAKQINKAQVSDSCNKGGRKQWQQR